MDQIFIRPSRGKRHFIMDNKRAVLNALERFDPEKVPVKPNDLIQTGYWRAAKHQLLTCDLSKKSSRTFTDAFIPALEYILSLQNLELACTDPHCKLCNHVISPHHAEDTRA